MPTLSPIRPENERLLTLWHRSQAGDKAAFCQLAETQYRALFAYATHFTDDREFIKDAIQEVFVRIWEKRATITPQFVAIYLFRSLRNELLQSARRHKPFLAAWPGPDAVQWSDGQTIETEIEQHEAETEYHGRIHRAIAGLPKRQQEAVFLKFYKGLENEQIALLMDINRQSVANLLHRALGVLKHQIALLLSVILVDY